MQNFIWNIDTEIIDWKNEAQETIQYTITGWLVSKIQAPFVVSVYFMENGEKLPAAVKWIPRPDVLERFSLSGGCAGPGFSIRTEYGFSEKKPSEERTLIIEVQAGNERVHLTKKTLDAIYQDYQKNILSYSLDMIYEDDGNMVLQGWASSKLGRIAYRVLDEKGELPEVSTERLSRLDINELYQKEPKEKLGFRLYVGQQCLNGDKLYIEMSDGSNDSKIEVNLRRYRMSQTIYGRMWKMFKPSKLRNTFAYMKEHGWSSIKYEVQKGLHPGMTNYEIWLKSHLPQEKELRKQKNVVFEKNPKFSIVIPLFNTPLEYLKEIVDSVLAQTYGNFELCLADGSTSKEAQNFIETYYSSEPRILYKRLERNLGISENTNEAIRMATGDYIVLADHDDVITPNAMYELAKAINEQEQVDILYTDEDKISMDGAHYFDPNFKPDFNLDYLRSTNYICHIFVVKKSIVDEVGMLQSEYDGAQDYDFILRCCERTNAICHIPKILYHWRAHRNSTAGNPESKQYAIDAGMRALADHYKRVGIEAEIRYTDIFIMFQTIPKIIGEPKVSVIISSKDHVEDLDTCIESIEKKSTWKNYEVIVVENNSEEKETFEYYEKIQKKYPNVKVVYWQDDFNYSAINNFGASYATGEYLILLNNDIEVITPEWIEYMLGYCQREDVGIVGAKLCYPDDTVQHCGAVIGMGGFAGHILTKYDKDVPGPYGRLKAIHDVSAVTAACLMVKKSVFDQVNGLDESFKVALNDMDFCLRVRREGKLIVINPWAELYHYESKSRGMEDDPEKLARFRGEIERFRSRWKTELENGDPYYNPNLTRKYTDCSIRYGREKFDLVD